MPRRWNRCAQVLATGLLAASLAAGCGRTTPTAALPTAAPVLTPAPAQETMTSEPTAIPTPAPTLPPATAEPVPLQNPGFEDAPEGSAPSGWTHTGATAAVRLDANGHTGAGRLTHQAAEAYTVESAQTVSGLTNQWYTLRGWVRSSGGQTAVYLALQCGATEQRVDVPPTTPGYRWIHLAVANQVTDGQCTIRLRSEGAPDTWASFDDIELVPGRAALSILGADISSLAKSEALGGTYGDAAGLPQDALQILTDNGLNYARLRVWVDPADGKAMGVAA